MLVHKHVIINLIISLILLFFIQPIYVLIIFLSSVLIDVDHYFYYIFKRKRFSLKSAYNWNLIEGRKFKELSLKERKKHQYFIFILHSIELLLILLILSRFSIFFFLIFIGFSIHLLEDSIEAQKFKFLKRRLFLFYAIPLHKKIKQNNVLRTCPKKYL